MDFVSLEVVMVASEPVQLPPFMGSSLRGGLGHALKAQGCTSHQGCGKRCELPFQCAYGSLMETPIAEHAPSRVKASATAPHTLLISVPQGVGGLLLRGQELRFELTLVAGALAHLPVLIGALEEMATQGLGKGLGSLKLKSVRDQVSAAPVYYLGKRDWSAVTVQRLTLDREAQDERVDAVEVRFVTPVQLRRAGVLVESFDFGELVYACADRVWLMGACHAPGLADELRAAEVAERARAMNVTVTAHELTRVSFDRWSNRQERKHPLEGMLGVLRFEGPVGNFMPLLRAAQLLHLGKGTTFGLGQIEVRPIVV